MSEGALTLTEAASIALGRGVELLEGVIDDKDVLESIKYNIEALGIEGVLMYVGSFGQTYEQLILNLRVDELMAEMSTVAPSIYEICARIDDKTKERAGKILRVLYNVARSINSAN